MLKLRRSATTAEAPQAWLVPDEHGVVSGLQEDVDYLVRVEVPDGANAALFIDDEPMVDTGMSLFHWRPSLQVGRVRAELRLGNRLCARFELDVAPSPAKAARATWDVMVDDVRAAHAAWLAGGASARLAFGHGGAIDGPVAALRLARLRQHGDAFLHAVAQAARVPHRHLALEARELPLSQVRRLPLHASRDRRIAAMASALQRRDVDPIDNLRLRVESASQHLDTPANRTLLALMNRFGAALRMTRASVERLALAGEREDQARRAAWRVEALDALERRLRDQLELSPFNGLSSAAASSAGLTQVAAMPAYARAYRLGFRALATGMSGSADDLLPVLQSWGVYETWCFVEVVQRAAAWLDAPATPVRAPLLPAQMAFEIRGAGGQRLELLFQAVFRSSSASGASARGFSISRERRPDIVVVSQHASGERVVVLDAKWRSGRENILDAMQSAHVYHDALRLFGRPPDACLLLAPGEPAVPELESDAYFERNRVGVASRFVPGGAGPGDLVARLREVMRLAPGVDGPPTA